MRDQIMCRCARLSVVRGVRRMVAFAAVCRGTVYAAAPVFGGPTVTNVAGCDAWRETAMTDIVVRAGSALDLSGWTGRVPAGAYGWARPAADGSLRFEKRPDEKVRLYGCVEGTISYHRLFDGCTTRERRRAAIVAFVRQYRRMGFNFIRPHGLLDGAFDITRFRGRPAYTEEELDDLDFFLAACKKGGIYVYIDLAAYGLRDPKLRNQIWKKAGVMVKEPAYWELWENCARAILNRVNRYTRLAWKDDPAVLGVMEYNEQATGAKTAVQSAWPRLDPAVKRAVIDGFRSYLAAEAPSLSCAGIDETAERLPVFYGRDRRGRLLHRYLSGLFAERALDYNAVVRATGYPGLLTTYNSDVDYGACAARWRASEAVPYNVHSGHPHGGGSGYAGARVSQRSSIEEMVSGSGFCYGNRIRLADRPYIVTENSRAFWNADRQAAALMTPVYGALNGYSGILWHEGGGDVRAMGGWPRGQIGVFKVSTSPIMRAAAFLGAMLFRRGDVAESDRRVTVAVPDAYWRAHSADAPSTTQARLGLILKCGLTFPALARPPSVTAPLKADITIAPGSGDEIEDGLWVSRVRGKESRDFDIDAFVAKLKARGIIPKDNATSPKDKIYQSETGEITVDGNARELAVVTPRTEAVCLPAGRRRKLGIVTVETGEDCCAALTSVDGQPLATSRRMVFLWMTRESNAGMVTSADGRTMVRMGRYPALLKTGKVAFCVKVTDPRAFRLWLLDYSGARLEEIPLRRAGGSLIAAFDTGKLAKNPTPFFELSREGRPGRL